MSFEHKKFAVILAWAFCVIITAVVVDVPSISAWAVVVGFALIPPAIALRLVSAPALIPAESIVRR